MRNHQDAMEVTQMDEILSRVYPLGDAREMLAAVRATRLIGQLCKLTQSRTLLLSLQEEGWLSNLDGQETEGHMLSALLGMENLSQSMCDRLKALMLTSQNLRRTIQFEIAALSPMPSCLYELLGLD
jgi:hypothetical protein